MANARNPLSIEAEKRYLAGERLIDIAKSLKVSDSTVRRWKSTQNWDGKKKPERSKSNPSGQPKKPTRKAKPKTVDEKLVERVEENEELTAQQKDFCLRFVRTCNATQAYVGAFDCTYNAARSSASRMLTFANIQQEIKELRKIIHLEYGGITGKDVVAMHMKIAFADIHDYVEFESKLVPVTFNGTVLMMEHPKTKKQMPVTKSINVVKLRDSAKVDGQLITEVSEGREGAKIKLADKQRSLAFLERYFKLNPMDTHRMEYDDKRHELELVKAEAMYQVGNDEEQSGSSNFLEAMMGQVDDLWGDDVEPDEELTDE